jgi:hypothetical protein
MKDFYYVGASPRRHLTKKVCQVIIPKKEGLA